MAPMAKILYESAFLERFISDEFDIVGDYRLLGHALANQAHRMDLLRLEQADMNGTNRSRALLLRWRVPPAKRHVEWGFDTTGNTSYPPVNSAVVGDIGCLTENVDGNIHFRFLSNVAEELGGVKIYNVYESGGQAVDDGKFRYVRELDDIEPIIYSHTASLNRADLAWSYLSRNALSISAKYGLRPEDLVLVTTTMLYVNATDQSHHNGAPISFDKLRQAKRVPMFDCIITPQGQLHQYHWTLESDPKVPPSKEHEQEIKDMDVPEPVMYVNTYIGMGLEAHWQPDLLD
ncbi:hypothetical protein FRC02_010346 [Tulasnella sp. 418]|nr:hypothetical protein FRC02_010346 [Tulasnella sp. 418]